MTFLELTRRLARECGITGELNVPASVVNQKGELGNCVNWGAEAYNDLQRRHFWRWLRRRFTFQTVASDDTYAFGDVNDTVLAQPIDRFRAWRLADLRMPPKIYLTSAGVASQRDLIAVPYDWFMYQYKRGVNQTRDGYPVHVTVDPQDNLLLGPVPNAIYTVDGEYHRGAQALVTDLHEPEMPADLHMLIVWKAMIDYGYTMVAAEAIQRANKNERKLVRQLEKTQLETIRSRGPMA